MKYYIRVMMLLLLLAVCSVKMYAQSLIAAEYFLNTDPGVGSGTPLSITAGDSVNTTVSIPLSALPPGFSQLFIRFKNNLNSWGIAEQRTFYVDNSLTAICLCKIRSGSAGNCKYPASWLLPISEVVRLTY